MPVYLYEQTILLNVLNLLNNINISYINKKQSLLLLSL